MIDSEQIQVANNVNKISRYKEALKQFSPFVFYSTVMLALGISSFASGAPAASMISALLFFGLLSWGLTEYLVHRFVLHNVLQKKSLAMPGYQTHLRHHANPRDLTRRDAERGLASFDCVRTANVAAVGTLAGNGVCLHRVPPRILLLRVARLPGASWCPALSGDSLSQKVPPPTS